MLYYLKGTVTMQFDGGIIIESGGVGFKLSVPDNTSFHKEKGSGEVTAYTCMIVREDDISLYGFSDKGSLDMFQMLRTVNGVGAKAALAVLSTLSLEEVKKAIIFDDPDTLTRAYGIGKKTASRIVLELKEKVGSLGELSVFIEHSAPNEKAEAVDALSGLGYSRSEALEMLSKIIETDLSAEEYIKLALRGTVDR